MTRRTNPQGRKRLGYLLVIVCLIAFAWYHNVMERREEEAFLPLLQQLAQINLRQPLPRKPSRRPFLRDKVLLVEGYQHGTPPLRVSRFQSQVPPELRATRPEEVGTVVFIRSESAQKVGIYVRSDATNSPAFCRSLDVLVIDATSWKVLDEGSFTRCPLGREDLSEDPFPELLSYLQGLPRA